MMVGCVGALVLKRFTDEQMIAGLETAYRSIATDDPRCKKLRACPASMRKSLTRSRTKYDDELGPEWSKFR